MNRIAVRRGPLRRTTAPALRRLAVASVVTLCLVHCGGGDERADGGAATESPGEATAGADDATAGPDDAAATVPTVQQETPVAEGIGAERTESQLRRSVSFDLGRVSQRLRSDGNALFVQQEPGRIVRIDPEAGSAIVVASWAEAVTAGGLPSDLAVGGIGFLDGFVAAAFGSAGSERSRLIMFDPTTLTASDSIEAAPDSGPIVVGQAADSSLVGLVGAGALAERRDDALEPVLTTDAPTPLVEAVAVDGDVWALSPPASAVIAFAADGTVARRVDLPAPTSIGHLDESLWVASAATGQVVRIDPVDGTIAATIQLPGELVTQAFVRVGAGMVTATSLVAPLEGDSHWQLSLIDPALDVVVDTVVLGSDPDLAPASAILDERLYVIEDGTTMIGFDVVTTDRSTGTSPTDEPIDLDLGPSGDERALTATVERALDYSMPVDVDLLSTTAGLGRVAQETVDAVRALGREQGKVRGTSILDDTALVSFDVVDGAGDVVVRGALLTARRVDGSWRLDSDWFCAAADEVGVACP